MSAIFYIDASVLAAPGLENFAIELDDELARTRSMFPLETVVLLPPLIEPAMRARIGAMRQIDIVGLPGTTGIMIAGAVVRDHALRSIRHPAVQVWVLTGAIETKPSTTVADRLSRLMTPWRILSVLEGVATIDVDDMVEVFAEHARSVNR